MNDKDIWELRQGDVLIGTLDVYDQDMFNHTAHFMPTAAFEPYRGTFAEGSSIPPEREDLWDQWAEKILSSGMKLIRLRDQKVASMFILYINDDIAGFRALFDDLNKG